MRIIVRPLAEGDLDAASEIERQCFTRPWSREALAEAIRNEASYFVVAVLESGVLAGCAGMHAVCGECYIDTIAVPAAFRRKGVGRAMLEALVRLAEQMHAAFLSLEVRPSNGPAIGLYRSMGFDYIGIRPGFYDAPKEDAAIYTRWLCPGEMQG